MILKKMIMRSNASLKYVVYGTVYKYRPIQMTGCSQWRIESITKDGRNNGFALNKVLVRKLDFSCLYQFKGKEVKNTWLKCMENMNVWVALVNNRETVDFICMYSLRVHCPPLITEKSNTATAFLTNTHSSTNNFNTCTFQWTHVPLRLWCDRCDCKLLTRA